MPAGMDAASATGVLGVDSAAGPLGAADTTAAEGNDGSDAGASGGGAAVAALVGSTTAVAAGESGVCRSQAPSDAARAMATRAERDPMNPPVRPGFNARPCWKISECEPMAASARNGMRGEKRDACEVGTC